MNRAATQSPEHPQRRQRAALASGEVIVRNILLACVLAYRWALSPLKTYLLGPNARCRFTPSCSQYALTALRCHGAWLGMGLATRRICRCHPWGGHGWDPVPESIR